MTLFMLAILLRWLGTWIEFDLASSRFRWVCRITDPPIRMMRDLVPALGPWDAGPLLTLLLTWIVREFLVAMALGPGPGA